MSNGMKVRAIKDLHFSRYLKILSNCTRLLENFKIPLIVPHNYTRIQTITYTNSVTISYYRVCGWKSKHSRNSEDIEEKKWMSIYPTGGLTVFTDMNKSCRGETGAAYRQMAHVWPAVCNRFQALVIKPSRMITNGKSKFALVIWNICQHDSR